MSASVLKMGCCISEERKLRKLKKVADFSFSGKTFLAKVVDVYDGDTLRIAFFQNKYPVQYRARMIGYDSPEMRPVLNLERRENVIMAANDAKRALSELVLNKVVIVRCAEFDKYGRILVTLVLRKPDPAIPFTKIMCERMLTVNDYMINSGFGVPYDGGTK